MNRTVLCATRSLLCLLLSACGAHTATQAPPIVDAPKQTAPQSWPPPHLATNVSILASYHVSTCTSWGGVVFRIDGSRRGFITVVREDIPGDAYDIDLVTAHATNIAIQVSSDQVDEIAFALLDDDKSPRGGTGLSDLRIRVQKYEDNKLVLEKLVDAPVSWIEKKPGLKLLDRFMWYMMNRFEDYPLSL